MKPTAILVFVLFAPLAYSPNPSLAQSQYKQVEVQKGGTIRGTVRWKKPNPTLEKVAVLKDHAVCGKHQVLPCLRLGRGGALADAIVYLEGILQGKKSLPANGAKLDQKNCVYLPHVLVIPAGATLEILNSDAILHNVHVYDMARPSADSPQPGRRTLFNIAFPRKEQKVTRVMDQPGKYIALCDAGHPWMSGYIFVTEHPYYAVSNEEGIYILDNVPAGSYNLRLWHEPVLKIEKSNFPYLSGTPTELTRTVTVPADGTVTIDFDL